MLAALLLRGTRGENEGGETLIKQLDNNMEVKYALKFVYLFIKFKIEKKIPVPKKVYYIARVLHI